MGAQAVYSRRLGALGCAAGLCLVVACRAQGDRDRDAELARILFAVERVREADYRAKGGARRALEQEPCTASEICALRDICVAGYRQHERSLELARSVGDQIASVDPVLLAKQLSHSELLLKSSREQLEACNQRAKELRRLSGR